MNLEELKDRILSFRTDVQNFNELLARPKHRARPAIVNNREEIARNRTVLNSEFGRLDKYLEHFGNNPKMRDGANPEYYFAYVNAFSGDILQRVLPSLRLVVQDLDIISGKLINLTEEEFEQAMTPRRRAKEVPSAEAKGGTNWWEKTNPIWLVWKTLKWSWQHKLRGFLILVITLVAIDYALARSNIISAWNFLSSLF